MLCLCVMRVMLLSVYLEIIFFYIVIKHNINDPKGCSLSQGTAACMNVSVGETFNSTRNQSWLCEDEAGVTCRANRSVHHHHHYGKWTAAVVKNTITMILYLKCERTAERRLKSI